MNERYLDLPQALEHVACMCLQAGARAKGIHVKRALPFSLAWAVSVGNLAVQSEFGQPDPRYRPLTNMEYDAIAPHRVQELVER